MPGIGFAAFHRFAVSPRHALVAQRAELLQLHLADAAAGFGERLQLGLRGQFPVELDEFAEFMAGGVIEGALNRRKFNRQENVLMIGLKEAAQRPQIAHLRDAYRGREFAERYQPVGRAQLLGKRMPVAQPIGRFACCRL